MNQTTNQTTQVIAVYGKTFAIKDTLKAEGFRFRRTGGSHEYVEKYLDKGFTMDVSIWYIETADPKSVLDFLAKLCEIKVKIDGKNIDLTKVDIKNEDINLQDTQARPDYHLDELRSQSKKHIPMPQSENWQEWDDESGPGDSTLPSKYFRN